MGVLDDIRSALTGPTGPVTETIVPTALPPQGKGAGILEKIGQQLSARDYEERVNSLIQNDPRGPITLPKPGQAFPIPEQPITVTPRPPVNGVAQDPKDLDVFQKIEIQKQLEAREKRFVGPRKPITDMERDKMSPEPSLGYGTAAVFDAIGATVDQIGQSFNPKTNPMLKDIVDQALQNPASILPSLAYSAYELPAGLLNFVASTGTWLAYTGEQITHGKNVLDAIADGQVAAEEFATSFNQDFNKFSTPISQGVVGTVAVPFTATGQLLQLAVGQFTDDPRIKSSAQLLFDMALLFGGEKGFNYIQKTIKGKSLPDPRSMAKVVQEGTKNPMAGIVAESIATELDPQFKLASAMQNLAKRMDEEYVVRKHHEERVARDLTMDPAEKAHHQLWANVLGEEIKSRGLKPLERPTEWFQEKYPTIDAQAEIMGPTLGIAPLFTDPKWYWYMKEKGQVPEGYPAPAGAEAYAPRKTRKPLPSEMDRAPQLTPDVETRKVGRVDAEGKPILDKDGNQYMDSQYWKKVEGLSYDEAGNPIRKTVDTQVIATEAERARLHRMGKESRIPASLRETNPHTEGGYVVVPGPIGHPNLRMNGSITQSRLVYEQAHGRTLGTEEVVHHKDLTKTNNNPDNLFAFPNQEAHRAYHASQAAKDLASQLREEGYAKPNEFTWYIEDTADMEFMPAGRGSTTAKPVITDTQILYKVYGDNRGGLQAVEFGKGVPKPDITRATKGAIQFPPEEPGSVPAGPGSSIIMKAQEHIEPATKSHVDNGGSTFNTTRGDMAGSDTFAVSPYPERQVSFDGKEIPAGTLDKFWRDNAELIATDPEHLGVGTWFNVKDEAHPLGDNKTYIDVTVTIPKEQNGKAAADYLGRKYDQIAITHLDPEFNFPSYETGGTGGKNIDPNWVRAEERLRDPELVRIMNEKPGPGEPGTGAPPATEPPAGAPPSTPPPAGGALAPSGDPAVALFEALQSPGLTIQPEGQAKTFRQRAESWVTALLDRFYPVHKYSKRAGKLLQGENPSLMIKAGALSGMTGKAEGKIFRGGMKTDIYGMNHPTGEPALNKIYEPFRDDMPGFDKYLISRAALEEEALNKYRKPADWVHTGVDLADAQAYVTANAAKYDASAKQYTKFFHGLLDELAESGLLDPEVKYEWRSKRPEYAPLRRDMDALVKSLEDGGNKGLQQTLDRISSPVKARLGSDKPILPPSQSAIIMTYEITAAVERQKVAKAIVGLRDKFGMEDLITEIFPGPAGEVPTGRDIVMVRDAGKAHWYKVPEDLADSMKMIHEAGLGEWVKKLSIPSRWLRTGATSAPGFAVRNPIRDWQTAFVNSKSGFNPITDFTKGLWSVITKDKDYWDWKESGAEWSMLVTLDKAMAEEAIRQMKAETTTGLEAWKAKWLKSPLAYLEKLSELGEKPTRIGVFKRNQRAGISDMEAAAESRSASTDFATRGSKTKAVSALYTFLNARAQTTYKLAQTAVEHPGQFVVRGLASAALPTLILYALNRDDPEYWKRDKKERAMFWFLPIKIGGRQVKLPKGELGIIFGNAVETVLEAIDSTPEGRMKVSEYLDSVFDTVSPVGNVGELAPTFARPGIEWITNTKYYSGTPIENETEKGVAPYLRYGPYTSETAKAVGQAAGVFNSGEGVSPKKLENALYGYTGGVGRMTLGLVDWLAGKAGILPSNEKPKEPASGTPLRPIVQGFMSQRATGFESEPARMFYAASETVEMTKKTLENLVKQGPGKREGEIKAWMENHPYEMELLKLSQTKNASGNPSNLFLNGREELANLRKAEQKIGGDQTMSAEDKRKALDMIDKRVSAIVDPVWKLLNAVSRKGSKGPKD